MLDTNNVVNGFWILDEHRSVKCSEGRVDRDSEEIVIRYPLWVDGVKTDEEIAIEIYIERAVKEY